YRQPRWDGSELNGRRVLLANEQGLGDTLHFIRYAPLVKQRGGTVLFSCPKPLVRLLGRCPGIDHLVPDGDPLPDFDVYVPLLSLPGLLGTSSLAAVPAAVPYLFPVPALAERWGKELSGVRGLKVGIAWQGDPKHREDHLRSVPLAQFAPLAAVSDVTLVSLQ